MKPDMHNKKHLCFFLILKKHTATTLIARFLATLMAAAYFAGCGDTTINTYGAKAANTAKNDAATNASAEGGLGGEGGVGGSGGSVENPINEPI